MDMQAIGRQVADVVERPGGRGGQGGLVVVVVAVVAARLGVVRPVVVRRGAVEGDPAPAQLDDPGQQAAKGLEQFRAGRP